MTSDVSGTSSTVRNIVKLSVRGSTVRIRISNVFSSGELKVGKASVGEPGTGAALEGKARRVTFRGHETVVVPRGSEVLSDPVHVGLPAPASPAGTNRRWTDALASRTRYRVVNSGISGNQLLRDGTYWCFVRSSRTRDVESPTVGCRATSW